VDWYWRRCCCGALQRDIYASRRRADDHEAAHRAYVCPQVALLLAACICERIREVHRPSCHCHSKSQRDCRQTEKESHCASDATNHIPTSSPAAATVLPAAASAAAAATVLPAAASATTAATVLPAAAAAAAAGVLKRTLGKLVYKLTL
jgi:hypothetical protein